MAITKQILREALGFTTDAEIARWFGIGRWAVGQWLEGSPIPRGRQVELVARSPDRFKFDADGRVVAYGAPLDPVETGKSVALSPD